MNTGMISVRYAKALLEFAYEKKCAEKVYGEMANVARSYEQETRCDAYWTIRFCRIGPKPK